MVGRRFRTIHQWIRRVQFPGSANYWERRYRKGRTSGPGSFNRVAEFKAEVLNIFVQENQVKSVVEFGCGDGNQLSLLKMPRYIGIDISRTAIELCKKRFGSDATKTFICSDDLLGKEIFSSDLAISLDVIFHLVEDTIFREYMAKLFGAATKYVIIYSSNHEEPGRHGHVRHRKFDAYVERHFEDWRLVKIIQNKYPFVQDDARNTSISNFYIYEKC